MMFTAFNTECDSSSRCSSASPAGDNLGYYPSPAGSYSSMGSPQSQDFTDLSAASASFIPTVTAISTSPDMQWMMQPVISSVAPSHRAHPYESSPSPAYPRAFMKASGSKTSSKRGKMEQLSPQEEEKRRIRRERNKQAAAKCRNRRRELTDTLQAETDELEDQKANLQNDIANLLKEKERLEFILAAHRPICKIPSQLDTAFPAMTLSPAHSCASSAASPTSQTSISAAAASVTTTTTAAAAASTPSTFTSTSNSIFSSGAVLPTSASAASDSVVSMSDLDARALEESLELLAKTELETARSVPEVDLPSSLCTTQDWEPLYTSAGSNEYESLCTPVVTCTPSCTTYTSSFVFTYPDAESFPTCGVAHRRGSSSNEQSSDSLSSPTLLAL